MNNLQRVPLPQQSRSIDITGEDIPVELNHDPTRTNPEVIKQLGHTEPGFDLFFFSVDMNNHRNKKTVPNRTTLNNGAREYGPESAPIKIEKEGTKTFTLPYAGTTRIRFKGLPNNILVLSSQFVLDEHP